MNPLERVLIADDEPLSREFLCEAVGNRGHAVTSAEDGAEAIRLFRDSPFDLVISDMRMPHADGMDVLRAVRALSPETPVILITAFGDVESAVSAMREGANDFLQKPFSCDQIDFVLDRLEDRMRLVRENRFLRDRIGAVAGRDDVESEIGEHRGSGRVVGMVRRGEDAGIMGIAEERGQAVPPGRDPLALEGLGGMTGARSRRECHDRRLGRLRTRAPCAARWPSRLRNRRRHFPGAGRERSRPRPGVHARRRPRRDRPLLA